MPKWQPGVSGNPGGRPKADVLVRELARDRTEEAIKTLVLVMRNKKSPPSARVQAAQALLDRGWGKPTQMTEITGKDGGPIETTPVDNMELARRIVFMLENAAHEAEHEAVH